jgi:hypothetical protein
MHYKADGGWDFYPPRFRGGSLFGLSSATETSIVSESATAKLFSINSTTTFKAGRSEVGVSENDILVRGGAVYTVIFNQVDRVFTFRNVEINRRAYAYNESSIVNVEGIDYGYITDTVTLSEDYGFIGNQDLEFPWEVEDFGILDPRETRTPFGLARFYSFTSTPRSRTFIGNLEETHLLLRGSAKIYVLPKFTSKGDLINITSSTTDSRTNSEVGTGSLFGFDASTETTLVQPPIDYSQQRIFSFAGELVEKFGKGNYDASGTLFGYSSTTETRLVRDGFGELFNITGKLEEKSTFVEVGSGTLFGFDGAGESITFSYNEDSGFGACDGDDYGFISDISYDLIDYGAIGEYYQYNHEDYGNLYPDDCLEPQGKFKFHNGVDESRTNVYVGSGRIFGFTGAAESIGVESESVGIFRFAGNAAESTTPATEIGTGSLFSYVSFTETTAFTPGKVDPLFNISGGLVLSGINEQVSDLKFTAAWNGSGSLFKFSETDPSRTRIFIAEGTINISGRGFESTTPTTEIGSGSLFSYVSFTETKAVSESSKKVLFNFSGSATNIKARFAWQTTNESQLRILGNASVYVLPKHLGSGEIFIRSSGVRISPESFTPWIPAGSGSLFGYVGAAEAVGSNPPDNFTLFNVVGGVDTPLLTFSEEKFVQARFYGDNGNLVRFSLSGNPVGLQPVEIHGNATESLTKGNYTGSGSLFGFSSATESRVVNPPDKTTLFTFTGNAKEKDVNSEVGRGSLFTYVSFTETKVVSETFTTLFKFSGKLSERVSPAPHVGTGSLFGFSSTTESRVVNPPDETLLFKITGKLQERETNSEVGSGTPGLDINGSLVERSTFAHLGSGGLFGFSSTTESRVVIPPNLQNLFTVRGTGKDSITVPQTGSGSIFGFVGASESKSNTEVKYTLFTVTGTPIVRFIGSNVGVGQIRVGLSNPGIPGDISRGITVFRLRTFPQGPVVKFSGTKAESFTPAPHIAEGLIDILPANTKSRYVEFERPQPTRIVVI